MNGTTRTTSTLMQGEGCEHTPCTCQSYKDHQRVSNMRTDFFFLLQSPCLEWKVIVHGVHAAVLYVTVYN